jgi:nucleotide-binding universal stress UspA family protein
MLHLRTILHATDFSESSQFAFRLACSLARDHGARVVVLHVVPPPIAHGEVVARRQGIGYHEELWQQLHRIQPPDPLVRVEHCLRDGPPAAEIAREAKEMNADLIVVGTQGRTGLARVLLGSVAEEVLRQAACPVLTVKAPAGSSSALVADENVETCRVDPMC